MTFGNSKSHAHLQIMMKVLTLFQIISVNDVASVAGTRSVSARAKLHQKWQKQTNLEPHAYFHIRRRQSAKF